MKILKIRGRNLASLYGNFELDFTSSPLFGCGLFTITGETGAGKSTILDAMCLALYGRYPRIMGEGPKDKVENIAGESLQTNDPRSILRTGASDAYAQVDLMVGDKHLQASWQVRRAYGKAQGNLLDFQRSLVDLADGTVLASGKKRVDEEIGQRLKLTYEQFGRTVLLAQNDFDAFLRANDGDRADLLEKITGTELYSKLSAKAYETERQAQLDLADLQRQSGFIKVLPDEERAELCTTIKSTEQSHKKLQERSRKTSAAIDWYVRRDEARERVKLAQKQAVIARSELAKTVDQKKLLAKVEIATGLASLVDRADRAGKLLKTLSDEQTTRVGEQKHLSDASINADKHLASSAKHFGEAEQKLKEAAPFFERALKLDTQINSHLKRAKEGQSALEREQNRQREYLEQNAKIRAIRDQMRKQIVDLSRELEQKRAMAPLSVRSKDLAVLFQRLRKLQGTIELARVLNGQKKQLYASLQEQIKADEETNTALREQLAKAKGRREEKAQILGHAKPDEVRLKRDRQIDAQNQLNILFNHLSALVDFTRSIEKNTKVRDDAKDKASNMRQELHRLEGDLQALKNRAAEAGDVLQRSKIVLSKHVLELRAGLLDEQACPVCGSPDHPGHDDKATSAVLDLMRARTRELSGEIARKEQERNGVGKKLEHAIARAENADERLEGMQQKLDNLNPQTTLLYAKANHVAKPLGLKIVRKRQPEMQLSTIIELLEAQEHHGVTVQKQLMVIQQLEAESRSLEESVLALENASQEKTKETGKLEKSLKNASDELIQSRIRLEHEVDHHKTVLEQLGGLLTGIDVSQIDLQRDPESAEQFLQRQIKTYDRQKFELERDKKQLAGQEAEELLLGEKIKQQTSRLGELEGELADVRDYLSARKEQRRKLFDGRLIIDVRRDMEESLRKATKALQEASADKQQNVTRLEEVEKNLARLEVSLKTARQAQDKNLKARDEALRQQKLSLSEVVSLLAISLHKRKTMAEQLDKLETEQTRTTALLLDRKQHLEQIEKQSAPDYSKDQLLEFIQEIEAERAMLMIDLGKNNSRLELDDAALKQRAGLSGKLDRLEKNHALWAVVSGAIGSKDGAKFRKFAQGVTLDHLVALANQQLRNINPRYKIERNSIGGLGLQVVDVEMGGEIRSVRSLSGGERFLVSLALALALSQLDGRSSFVDTLMIDEGFGALDARSLDIVIEALESLQSQGRKVGVISHIEALTDRIPVQIKVEKQGNGRSRVRVVEHGFMGGE